MTWVPDSCTLPDPERPLRVAEFDELFAAAVRPAARIAPQALLLFLPPGDRVVSQVRELVARETACCSFFSFTVFPSAADTVLQAGVPESQVAVLDAVQQRAEAARSRGGAPVNDPQRPAPGPRTRRHA